EAPAAMDRAFRRLEVVLLQVVSTDREAAIRIAAEGGQEARAVIVDDDVKIQLFPRLHKGGKVGAGLLAGPAVSWASKRRISSTPRETSQKKRGFAGGISRSFRRSQMHLSAPPRLWLRY